MNPPGLEPESESRFRLRERKGTGWCDHSPPIRDDCMFKQDAIANNLIIAREKNYSIDPRVNSISNEYNSFEMIERRMKGLPGVMP